MIKLFVLSILLPISIFSQDIVISKDTIVNNTWVIPSNVNIRFESKGRIRGTGTIKGGIIQASLLQHIFDTSITVQPFGVYGDRFSCAWYGANPFIADNYWNIQKSINTCIASTIRKCFLPKGNYTYSQSLKMAFMYKGVYAGFGLHFFGEGDVWDEKTVLNYTGLTGFALGVQVGKGCEISNLTLRGKFVSPTTSGAAYYSTPIKAFGNLDYLYGLVIDYDGTQTGAGSTGIYVHDVKATGFTFLFSVSPNGITYNAEIVTFRDIQCGDGRVGFQASQAQEKGNEVHGIYSWGKIHTLIQVGQSGKGQAGNYTFNRANVANGCIRLFDIRQAGWYSINITNFFAESIGSVGYLQTGDSRNLPPLTISNSTFNFATIPFAGTQTLLTSNSTAVNFSQTMFRYYGTSDTLNFSGTASFTDCFFSGVIKNASTGSVYLREGVRIYNPVIIKPPKQVRKRK